LISILIGAVIYRIIIAWVLQMGLKPTDLKILTAIVVTLALTIPKMTGARALNKVAVSNAKGEDTNVGN
jgi:putative ABC transport system permease protein